MYWDQHGKREVVRERQSVADGAGVASRVAHGRSLVIAVVFAALVGGCGAPEPERADRAGSPAPLAADGPPEVQPVPPPDLSQLDESGPLQTQLQEGYDALMTAVANPDATPGELSRFYGDAGQLFMAAEMSETAERCFLNAHALSPTEMRWPYYLGHLYRAGGDTASAIEYFERARALEANDVPTLIWLGEMHLENDQPAEARLVFEHALALDQRSVAALFGLGRAALARRDYLRAVEFLEAALALNPRAIFIHDVLADAHDSLGQPEQAEANRVLGVEAQGGMVAGWSDMLLGADPLIQEVDARLQTPSGYERRGTRAVERGDPARGIALFRRGLEIEPGHPELMIKLGTALAIVGDIEESEAQFRALLEREPENADAHYSMAVLMEGTGRFQQALARYTSAVRFDTTHSDARLRLGRLLRLMGRHDDAMAQFERVRQLDPEQSEALFGQAMVLVSLGRWAEARARLEEGMEAFPDSWIYPLALARVLSAAPADVVRDGARALALLDGLPDEIRLRDFGESRAMALAEVGRFAEAARQLRDAMAAAQAAGLGQIADGMAADLTRFESGQPSRTPWRPGELP